MRGQLIPAERNGQLTWSVSSAGRLLLSLDKDAYELLGVDGRPSRFNHGTSSRFGGNDDIITIV